MQERIKFIGYHATDKSKVKLIQEEKFKYKHRDYHWLGDGSYFFIDPVLALNWSKNPTKKYSKIDEPAFLSVYFDILENKLCDMRNLDEYNIVKEDYEYYRRYVSNLDVSNFSYLEVRCAFFNWVFKRHNIACIIAYINERKNLSTRIKSHQIYKEFEQFKMPYIEVQICAKDNTMIKDIEIINLEGCNKNGNKT